MRRSSMLSVLSRRLPPSVRLPLRGLMRDIAGLPGRLSDRGRWGEPWQTAHFDGCDGDFEATGETVVRDLTDHGGMRPEDRVLDIGCGNGRVARPLAGFLSPRGRYVGFDLSRGATAGCRRRFRGDDRFTFHHADLINAEYNPRGTVPPEAFVFPCGDGEIDFAFAISVFTHLQADAVARYLAETGRVLAPGGRVFLTAFLLDDARERNIEAGLSLLSFQPWRDGAMVADPASPESAIAHPEALFRSLATRAGLVVERIHRGGWCPPSEPGQRHDSLVLVKSQSA